MAISFDWYENPVSPDKPEEKRFHPRIIANGQRFAGSLFVPFSFFLLKQKCLA